MSACRHQTTRATERTAGAAGRAAAGHSHRCNGRGGARMRTGSVVRVTTGVRYFGSFAKRNAASDCFERVREGWQERGDRAYGIQPRT